MLRKIPALVLALALLLGTVLPGSAQEAGFVPPEAEITERTEPAEDEFSEDAPAEENPSEDVPTTDTPSEENPSEDVPAADTPSEENPSKDVPAEDAPAEENPSEDVPAEDTPAEENPSEDVPAEDTPAGDIPAKDEEGGDIPPGDVPSGDEDAPAEVLPPENAPVSQGMITAILDMHLLEGIEPVVLCGSDPEPLYIRMLELRSLKAAALAPDGAEETLRLQVDWDLTRLSTDLSVPGMYSESAPILTPEGYCFAEGVPSAVVIPVIVQEAVPEVIVSFEDIGHSCAFAIRQGDDWEAFFEEQFSDDRWLYAWTCQAESGETLWAHIRWQNPHADTSETGEVIVHGYAVLPEDCVLAEGLELPVAQVSVSIQSAKRPALHSWYMSFGNLNIPWTGGDEDSALLLCRDDGEWLSSDALEYNGESMVVYLSDLEPGHSYRVKAQWSGGETGAFCFDWDGELRNVSYYEGDRDGGDSDGNKSETIVQPAPSKDKGAENAFYEESGDDYSLLSGARLRLMRESGKVCFFKQGVTLVLSDTALDALQLREDSRFFIRLQRTDAGFSLSVELDGEPVDSLPDTQVLLPADETDGCCLLVCLEDGKFAVSRGRTTGAANAAEFTIDATGAYSLLELKLPRQGFAIAADCRRALAAWWLRLAAAWLR